MAGGFGLAAGFGLAVALRAAAGLDAVIGLRATAVERLALDFCAGRCAGFATGFGTAAFERARFGRFGFDRLLFVSFAFDAVGCAFTPTIFFGEVYGLPARSSEAAAWAALARFLACLAIFLPTFANFRARFSTRLAARSASFSALARATALSASTLNRWTEAAWVADVADEEVATAISFLQDGLGA